MRILKPYIYRALFLGGLSVFAYTMYLDAQIPSDQFAEWLNSSKRDSLAFWGGLWIFFVLYLTVFSFWKFFTLKPKPHFGWFLIALIPVLGPYAFFEGIIARRKLLSNPAWELNPCPDLSKEEISAILTRRTQAAAIDYGLLFLVSSILVLSLGEWTLSPLGKKLTGWNAWLIPLIWFLYFPLVEFMFGRTLGKHIRDLKVVHGDGSKISFVGAIRRRLLDPFDFLYYSTIMMLKSPKSDILPRRLGDFWGHTWVVPKMAQPPNRSLN